MLPAEQPSGVHTCKTFNSNLRRGARQDEREALRREYERMQKTRGAFVPECEAGRENKRRGKESESRHILIQMQWRKKKKS